MQGFTMNSNKPLEKSTTPQQPLSNSNRIKSLFTAAEVALRKQFENKKV